MIIEITTYHRAWKPGDIVDVTTNFGNELIALGVARKHEDQARRDFTPKKTKAEEPQKIEVHNYFVTPEAAPEPEPEPRAKPKRKNK